MTEQHGQHTYTYPTPPRPPVERDLGPAILAAYGITAEQTVELELSTPAGGTATGGRLVEGTVVDATSAVVVIALKAGGRIARVPWAAITVIRDTTDHPAI